MRLLLAALVLAALPGRAVVTPPEDPVDRELRLVKPALVRVPAPDPKAYRTDDRCRDRTTRRASK